MSEPIDLNSRRSQRGDMMFLSCSCSAASESAVGWAVVCCQGGTGPVITGLVCGDCGVERGVVYGVVGAGA